MKLKAEMVDAMGALVGKEFQMAAPRQLKAFSLKLVLGRGRWTQTVDACQVQ